MPIARSESQTLITGVYRTGSEFLAQVLDSHPALSVTMYRVNVLRFVWNRFDPICEEDHWRAALDEVAGRLKARYAMDLNRNEIEGELRGRDHFGYGDFYDVVMSSLYLDRKITHWGEKCQLVWRDIPSFLEMMPNGRAITIVRDPRSVLASFKHYTYTPSPTYLEAVFNCFDAMKCSLKMQASLPDDRFIVVRYEDLARNALRVANDLFGFMRLDRLLTLPDLSARSDAYGNTWQANSAFHEAIGSSAFDVESSINRWKELLSLTEVGLTETVCGPLMEEFGYQRSEYEVSLDDIVRIFEDDDRISTHFRNWAQLKTGIQAFPTDPLDPQNWRSR